MDDTQQSRVSDAAATRKRRSSILKSQRPPRTPFSELEFNVATPTDTAKSRRVSFSKRTGVAEFVTNEATTTWKNFYEEHNKSLESSGNESGANAPRAIGHIGRNIFEQQFQEIEAVDFITSLDNLTARNMSNSININFTEQLASLDCTNDKKLTLPSINFEVSALTEQQSKIFSNDIIIPAINEMSGRIDVNFSEINDKDDLDEIERDLKRDNIIVQRRDVSEYIEVELHGTNAIIGNVESDMSLTETICSPKVVSKNISNTLNDKENNITDVDNNLGTLDNDMSITVPVTNKERTVLDDFGDLSMTKPITTKLLPGIDLNEENLGSNKRKTILFNDDADLSITRPITTKLFTEIDTNLEIIKPGKRNTIFDDFDLSMTKPITTKLLPGIDKKNKDSSMKTINDFDMDMSITVANIDNKEKRKTIVFDDDMCDLSMTKPIPSKLISNLNIEKETTDIKTDIYDDQPDMSMTTAIGDVGKRLCVTETNDLEKRRTIVFENDFGNLSMTRPIPTKMLFKEFDKEKTVKDEKDFDLSAIATVSSELIKGTNRKTIVFDDFNISITKTMAGKILSSKDVTERDDNTDVKKDKSVLNENHENINQIIDMASARSDESINKVDMSMTEVIKSDVVGKKRKTIVFNDNDLSITKPIDAKSNDKDEDMDISKEMMLSENLLKDLEKCNEILESNKRIVSNIKKISHLFEVENFKSDIVTVNEVSILNDFNSSVMQRKANVEEDVNILEDNDDVLSFHIDNMSNMTEGLTNEIRKTMNLTEFNGVQKQDSILNADISSINVTDKNLYKASEFNDSKLVSNVEVLKSSDTFTKTNPNSTKISKNNSEVVEFFDSETGNSNMELIKSTDITKTNANLSRIEKTRSEEVEFFNTETGNVSNMILKPSETFTKTNTNSTRIEKTRSEDIEFFDSEAGVSNTEVVKHSDTSKTNSNTSRNERNKSIHIELEEVSKSGNMSMELIKPSDTFTKTNANDEKEVDIETKTKNLEEMESNDTFVKITNMNDYLSLSVKSNLTLSDESVNKVKDMSPSETDKTQSETINTESSDKSDLSIKYKVNDFEQTNINKDIVVCKLFTTQNKELNIPPHIKNIPEGVKSLMKDLVKPMADLMPFGSAGLEKDSSSICSTQVQANLFTSSQIDFELTSKVSNDKSEKSESVHEKSEKSESSKYDINSSKIDDSDVLTDRQTDDEDENLQLIIDKPKLKYSDIANKRHRSSSPIQFDDKIHVVTKTTKTNRCTEINDTYTNYDIDSVNANVTLQPKPRTAPIPALLDEDSNITIEKLKREPSVKFSSILDDKHSDHNDYDAFIKSDELDIENRPKHLIPINLSKPEVVFDYRNPLNNILIVPPRDHDVHKYNPTINDVIESDVELIETKCSSDDQISSDVPSSLSKLSKRTSMDQSIETNVELIDTQINTVISMKGNAELLEAHSSLTLVDDVLAHSAFDVDIATNTQDISKCTTPNELQMNDLDDFNKSPVPRKISPIKIKYQIDCEKISKKRVLSPTTTSKSSVNTQNSKMKRMFSPTNVSKVHRMSYSPSRKGRKPGTSVTVQQLLAEYNIDPIIDQQIGEQVIEAITQSNSSQSSMKSPELVSSFTSSKNQMALRKSVTFSDTSYDTNTSFHNIQNMETDASLNVVAKIDMLPFMGSHECEWDTTPAGPDTWSFRLMHTRLRLTIRLEHRHHNATRSRVRADTRVLGITVEQTHRPNDEKNSVALLCVGFAAEGIRFIVSCDEWTRAGDIPALLRRSAAVVRVALRWGRAMHSARMHLAFTLDDKGKLILKVANIPLRCVWEVHMQLELVVDQASTLPWPRASDVRCERVLAAERDSEPELARVLARVPQGWGHAPATVWKVFKYLKNRTRDDELLGI